MSSSIASISWWIAPEASGVGEGEHLDLGELVDAVQPLARPAGGAGLGAEAVGQADVFDRQLLASSSSSSACMPPSVISAVPTRLRSVSSIE